MNAPGTIIHGLLPALIALAMAGPAACPVQAQTVEELLLESDSTPAADSTERGLRSVDYALSMPVTLADTIPPGFFQIVVNMGLNRYTTRLIDRFDEIPDALILQALAQSNRQIDYLNINAYTTAYAINLLARQDSLWQSFFADLDMQFREPNILRFNFSDDQKWKSYALNDLFYSAFLQELLLRLGNIGIGNSRDGKQWLAGWPDELRWKYREYRFEYLPEDVGIRVLDPSRFAGGDTAEIQPSGVTRINPIEHVLPVSPADSVEPPYRVPNP
ncbi:MAG: hypothetical protein FVQ81_00275 [Candidatus Glassbacteria bacterium]|nr:hypothetical protein [Candidatus Glassbacteria bacterium]